MIVLYIAAAFVAGYLLRGWLAVLWERKRQQAPSASTARAFLDSPVAYTPVTAIAAPAVTARPAGRAHGVKPGDGTPLGALLADPELAWLFGRQDARHDDQETRS
jgi:hypothetical protein